MSIKSFLTLFFILIVFNPKITLCDEFIEHKLFFEEKNAELLKKDLELILSNNKFQISKSNDQMFEIYYDTPELHYYNNGGYIRYQAIQYLSKKKRKKKYRESIQHLFNTIDNLYSVKHYNNVKSFEEKHSLLGLVKRKERISFIDKIKEDGVEFPMRLKPIFQVGKISYNYNVAYENINFVRFKIYDLEINNLSDIVNLIIVEINKDREAISQFDSSKKESIELFIKLLEDEFIKDKNFENEYQGLVSNLEKNNKFFYFNFQYPEIIKLLYAIVMSVIGLIIISMFLVKRDE